MSAADYLRLVYVWLPGAFLFDFAVFGLALWLGKVRLARRGKR